MCTLYSVDNQVNLYMMKDSRTIPHKHLPKMLHAAAQENDNPQLAMTKAVHGFYRRIYNDLKKHNGWGKQRCYFPQDLAVLTSKYISGGLEFILPQNNTAMHVFQYRKWSYLFGRNFDKKCWKLPSDPEIVQPNYVLCKQTLNECAKYGIKSITITLDFINCQNKSWQVQVGDQGLKIEIGIIESSTNDDAVGDLDTFFGALNSDSTHSLTSTVRFMKKDTQWGGLGLKIIPNYVYGLWKYGADNSDGVYFGNYVNGHVMNLNPRKLTSQEIQGNIQGQIMLFNANEAKILLDEEINGESMFYLAESAVPGFNMKPEREYHLFCGFPCCVCKGYKKPCGTLFRVSYSYESVI